MQGPQNKDYSMLGSILGSPYFGKLPFRVWALGFRVLVSLQDEKCWARTVRLVTSSMGPDSRDNYPKP